MDARSFVERNRSSWERLEQLLERAKARGLAALEPRELRELGLLHRQVSADLAAARTFHAESRIVAYLNQLVLRSHNAVYRAPRRRFLRELAAFVRSVPPAVRRRRGAVAAATLLFFLGGFLGAIGTAVDEQVADIAFSAEAAQGVRDGHYWLEGLAERQPGSALSGFLLTNNTWVCLRIFAFGFTGLISAFDLFRNGAHLGSAIVLCGQYGLLSRLLGFIGGHGIIEISAVLLAGAGGFCVFDGWLHPGNLTRLQGLRRGAREGLRVAGAAVPALIAAAAVEGLISPHEGIPAVLRFGLGVLLAVVLWTWLLTGGDRAPVRDDPAP